MKKIFLFFVFSGIVTFMYGQNLSLYLNDGPRGTQHKVGSGNTYQMAFRISGLADDVAVTQFVSKCKSFQGVVDISVKAMDKTGQRSALVIFNEKKNQDYMKSFLKNAGISKIYSEDKEYTPDNLSLLKKERTNAGTVKTGMEKSPK